jgi:hypothetical protein
MAKENDKIIQIYLRQFAARTYIPTTRFQLPSVQKSTSQTVASPPFSPIFTIQVPPVSRRARRLPPPDAHQDQPAPPCAPTSIPSHYSPHALRPSPPGPPRHPHPQPQTPPACRSSTAALPPTDKFQTPPHPCRMSNAPALRHARAVQTSAPAPHRTTGPGPGPRSVSRSNSPAYPSQPPTILTRPPVPYILSFCPEPRTLNPAP